MREPKEYRLATSPEEAVAMLKAGPGKGTYVAGGTEVFQEDSKYDFVVDINQAGLRGIAGTEMGDVLVGAATPLQDCINSDVLQKFAGGEVCRVAGQYGNRPSRTAATIGGNVCSASPSAEMAPVLLALDAMCLIVDEDCQESIPFSDFFIGPRKTVLDGRLLAGLALSSDVSTWICETCKVNGNTEDIALVQVAVAMEVEEGTLANVRIALGSVAPVPFRCQLAEDQLTGLKLKEITPEHIEIVSVIAAGQCSPMDDHQASTEYRTDLVRQWVRRLICRVLAAHGMDACKESNPTDDDKGGAA